MTRTLLKTRLLALGFNAAEQEARHPDGLWQSWTTGRISPLDESSAQKGAVIRFERELVQLDLNPVSQVLIRLKGALYLTGILKNHPNEPIRQTHNES